MDFVRVELEVAFRKGVCYTEYINSLTTPMKAPPMERAITKPDTAPAQIFVRSVVISNYLTYPAIIYMNILT